MILFTQNSGKCKLIYSDKKANQRWPEDEGRRDYKGT